MKNKRNKIKALTAFLFAMSVGVTAFASDYTVYQKNISGDEVIAYTISNFLETPVNEDGDSVENITLVDFRSKGAYLDSNGQNFNVTDTDLVECLTFIAPVGFEISLSGLKNATTYMLKDNGNDTYVAVETDIINNGNITLQWNTNLDECFQMYLNDYEPNKTFVSEEEREAYKTEVSYDVATLYPDVFGMTSDSFVRFNKSGRYVFHGNKVLFDSEDFTTAIVIEVLDESGAVYDTDLSAINLPKTQITMDGLPFVINEENVDYIMDLITDGDTLSNILDNEVSAGLLELLLEGSEIQESIIEEITEEFIEEEIIQEEIEEIEEVVRIKNPRVPDITDKIYAVKNGETIGKIALNHYNNVELQVDLSEINKEILSISDGLIEGMELHLPEFIGSTQRLREPNDLEVTEDTEISGEVFAKVFYKYYEESSKYNTIYNTLYNIDNESSVR